MGFWKKKEDEIVIHNSKMNIIESCVDRHAFETPDKLAFVFEDKKRKEYSYMQLFGEVNRFANYLKKLRVKSGSRIFIFLPKVPESYFSFLGAIKHGSIAAPLFEAFQTDGLEMRLDRGDADVLVTNKELLKRLKNKKKGMKFIVVDDSKFKRDLKKMSSEFEAVLVDKMKTAMMIFTSSTAGTPVAGIEIPHYGLVQQHFTGQLVLELDKDSRYWCTAHPGWVTGSVYGIVAPLSIGCTNYVYSGRFDSRKWLSFLKKEKISNLYSAPTAFRLLKGKIKKSDLKYVKTVCSVGEALTRVTFDYYKQLGVRINDSYWQTETGAIVIASYASARKNRSMGKAVPGVSVGISKGTIAIKPGWPAMMTGIYKHDKMYKDYFKKGLFITNDSARKDKKGYFYFIGRKDDIIKTSGERVSPIEIEDILMKHKAVKEVGVIGVPDKIKGSILKAFVVLDSCSKKSESLKEELGMFVKKNYAGHAYPKLVEFVDSLPKTNSGKIIRMKLREIKKS